MINKNKLPDLLSKLSVAVEKGHLRFSKHALKRMVERKIIRLEIEFVLKNGYLEKRKDNFDKGFDSWNYAIKGKTVDGKNLRVVVSFEKPNFIVVSAIDLER